MSPAGGSVILAAQLVPSLGFGLREERIGDIWEQVREKGVVAAVGFFFFGGGGGVVGWVGYFLVQAPLRTKPK